VATVPPSAIEMTDAQVVTVPPSAIEMTDALAVTVLPSAIETIDALAVTVPPSAIETIDALAVTVLPSAIETIDAQVADHRSPVIEEEEMVEVMSVDNGNLVQNRMVLIPSARPRQEASTKTIRSCLNDSLNSYHICIEPPFWGFYADCYKDYFLHNVSC